MILRTTEAEDEGPVVKGAGNYINYRSLSTHYVRDPRLGHRLGRGSNGGSISVPEWNIKWLGTNNFGFYGAEDWPARPRPSSTVLLLGGSSAMGLGASERHFLLSYRLQEELALLGLNYSVINAAVGGYTSWQSLLYFATELVALHPQYIVCLDGHNDFVQSAWGNKYTKGNWLPNTGRSFDDALIATVLHSRMFSKGERLNLRWRSLPIAARLRRLFAHLRGIDAPIGKPGWATSGMTLSYGLCEMKE